MPKKQKKVIVSYPRTVCQRKVTEQTIPSELAPEIARRYLRGETREALAKAYNVDHGEMQHFLDTAIKPVMRDKLAEGIWIEYERVEELFRTAWEQFIASLEPATVEEVTEVLAEEGVDVASATTPRDRRMFQAVKRVVRKYSSRANAQWLDTIKWCIEWKSKHFYRTDSEDGSEFRVAGLSPQQVNQEMLRRLNRDLSEYLSKKRIREANAIPTDFEPYSSLNLQGHQGDAVRPDPQGPGESGADSDRTP